MDDDTDEELWSAIADPSRRRVLEALLVRDNVTQTELAVDLPFTRQAVAKHLVILERIGLVESRKLGREVRYAVNREMVDVAAQAMTRVASRWDRRLDAIKQAAERMHRESQ